MRRRHGMPFGAELIETGGTRFALWAPSARDVSLVLDGHDDRPMPDEGDGWRRLAVPEAAAGARYRFRADGTLVPDPASRFQPEDVNGPSAVVDPASFSWPDEGWRGRPWEEAVLYEVHVGTATPEGTFAALAERLPELVELGVTAVSLMPLNDFAGRRNWGYDGVLPFAPDSAYGTPDDLKRLVARAHGLGLMVVLDVVYNHFGPLGNYLGVYASNFITSRHRSPWGDGLNYDGPDGLPVREFFIHNALYWIEEYGMDGLRLDAVHAILDDSGEHLIAAIARRVREAVPDRAIHLVLENEHNEARWLERGPDGAPRLHTAQWNDDVHHCWHVLLTGEAESYYGDFADRPVERLARALAEGFVYQGEVSANLSRARGETSGHLPPTAFVNFLQNHDQVGNRARGDRLTESADPARISLARAGLLLCPQIPMLFMGEEWAASSPFQFFVDFASDPDLSRAVRDGRRREFEAFKAFGEAEGGSTVPDPTAEETFRRSTLDHDEKAREPHRGVLAEVRALLALRRDAVVPLLKSGFEGASASQPTPGSLDVRWRFAGGTLRFSANFGEEPVTVDAEDGERSLWRSPGVAEGASFRLPAWTGVVLVGEAR